MEGLLFWVGSDLSWRISPPTKEVTVYPLGQWVNCVLSLLLSRWKGWTINSNGDLSLWGAGDLAGEIATWMKTEVTWIRASQVVPVVKNLPANAGDIKRRRFNPWGGTIPWQPIPVFLPGESHGQRSLAGYSSQSGTGSDTTEAT